MCIHILLLRFVDCPHHEPVPTGGPLFIPAVKCDAVLAALDQYHSQPELRPLQWPYPAPKACPIVWGTASCSGNVVTATCFGKCQDCRRLDYLAWLAVSFRNMIFEWAGYSSCGGDGGLASRKDMYRDFNVTSVRAKNREDRRLKSRVKKRKAMAVNPGAAITTGDGCSDDFVGFWQHMSDTMDDNWKHFDNTALFGMVNRVWGRYRLWSEVNQCLGRFIAALVDYHAEVMTVDEKDLAWTFLMESATAGRGVCCAGFDNSLPVISEEEVLDILCRDVEAQDDKMPEHCQEQPSGLVCAGAPTGPAQKGKHLASKDVPAHNGKEIGFGISNVDKRLGLAFTPVPSTISKGSNHNRRHSSSAIPDKAWKSTSPCSPLSQNQRSTAAASSPVTVFGHTEHVWQPHVQYNQQVTVRLTDSPRSSISTVVTNPLASIRTNDATSSCCTLLRSAVLKPAPSCPGGHHCQRSWPMDATKQKVVANAALVLFGTMDRDRAARNTRRIAPIFNSWLLSIDDREDLCGATVGVIDPNPAPDGWWERESGQEVWEHVSLGLENGVMQGGSHGRWSEMGCLDGFAEGEIAFLMEEGLL